MRAVVDSSSWISLARAGLLNLLPAMPVEAVLLDVVHDEIVAQGARRGHPEAPALSALERIDAFANERREDRSTAIRQLVDIALRELSKRDALIAYRQGRLTIREFAAALNLDVWAAHDLLAAEGVAIAQGSRAETVDAL